MVEKEQGQEKVLEEILVVINPLNKMEVKNLLHKKSIPFKMRQCVSFESKPQRANEIFQEAETSLIPINMDISNRLKQVSEITGISLQEMATDEMQSFMDDFIRENPIVFLECYRGIENYKNPIEIVRKLQPIVNIPEKFMKEIENTDPIEYLKKWNPLKFNK